MPDLRLRLRAVRKQHQTFLNKLAFISNSILTKLFCRRPVSVCSLLDQKQWVLNWTQFRNKCVWSISDVNWGNTIASSAASLELSDQVCKWYQRETEMSGLDQIGPKWDKSQQAKMYWNWSLKVPDLSHLRPIWANLESTLTSLDKNLCVYSVTLNRGWIDLL